MTIDVDWDVKQQTKPKKKDELDGLSLRLGRKATNQTKKKDELDGLSLT